MELPRLSKIQLIIIICLAQKAVLFIYLFVMGSNVVQYNDLPFYLDDKVTSINPYFYWRKIFGFQTTKSFLALSSAFIFSTIVLLIYYKSVLKYRFNEKIFFLLIFALILNPYYNLYFLKNTADFLGMNLIILFCVFWYQKRPFFMALLGLLIVLCKPFLLLFIGYIMQSHLKLNIALVFAIIFGIFGAMLLFDYNVLVDKILIGIDTLNKHPVESFKSYASRMLSFFTQREGSRFKDYQDLSQVIDIFMIFKFVVLLAIAFFAINYIFRYDWKLFLVFVISVLIITLNAGHLRYAFLFYVIAFHLRVIR